MKQRFFGFLAKHKKLSAALISVSMLMTMGVLSFAEEVVPPTLDVTAIMTSASQKIVTDTFGMIGGVVPIIATLFAASVCIAYGFNFVKKVIGKAK